MGVERRVVDALFIESKETLQNVDQAFEIMYDPSRHNFFTTNERAILLRLDDDMCAICENPRD